MTNQDDAGFGCSAFGHLASAFVDAELPVSEMGRFETHLPGCVPCERLCAQYRAIDIAAMPAYPRPSDADWAQAWEGVRATIEADRAEAAASPAAALLRFRDRVGTRATWLRPLVAAAAAVVVIGLSLALRQDTAPGGTPEGVISAGPSRATAVSARLVSGGTDELSVACQSGWEPVVWTLGGDDPMTVVQCQPMET